MKLFESRIGPSVFKSYYKHAERVFETVERMNDCVKAACEGTNIKEHIKATSKSELKADKIKNKIRDMLRGSVRLAVDKSVEVLAGFTAISSAEIPRRYWKAKH